jgi:hypothetical protein
MRLRKEFYQFGDVELHGGGDIGSPGTFGAAAPADADFDSNGIVDGLDFLWWQRGDSPEGGSAAELALWEAQYGGPPPIAAAVSTGAVPEPTTIVLLGLALVPFGLRRRRDS